MLSVRRVPEEQKLCKLLLKTARRVGQVIQRSSEHQLHWQRYVTNSVTAHNNKKNPKQWHLALNRYAQAPPSDSVSNLQQRLLPDPQGPGKLQPLPRESLLPCENSASPEKWNLCALTKKKKVFHMFCNKDFCSLRVLMWVPFSVPVMHSAQRAVWPPASAWRLSSVKQGTLVNLLLSLLLC